MSSDYSRDLHGFRMEVTPMPGTGPGTGAIQHYTAKVTNLTTGETFENPGWAYWTAVGIARDMHAEQVAKAQK